MPWPNVHAAGGTNYLNFELSVQTPEENLICKTKWGSCRIRYEETHTPSYIDTIPNQVTYGMTINMVMNPGRCHYDLPADWDPFYYIKIGDTMTDWEGLTDSSTRLWTWQRSPITTTVGRNPPTKSVDPNINFS